jgi:hypothetical protein
MNPIYYIIQDINLLLEKLQKQEISQELQQTIEQAKIITNQINQYLQENNQKEIYKKLLELKTLEFKLIFFEVKNTTFYQFWDNLIYNIKQKNVTSEELYEFYQSEMNKLMMNAEIVANILILEDEDITFKTILDIMFGEAFRNYYIALQKLNEYISSKKEELLDEIKELLPLVIFFFSQIQKIIPKEYSENIESLLEES